MRLLPLLLALLCGAPTMAGLTEADLAGVGATPPPGTRLPDLTAIDQDGRRTRWQDIVGGPPVLLLFADYTCRHLCGPGLTITAGALHDAGLVPDRDYRLVTIGIDPRDGAAAARAMRGRNLAMLPAERDAARLLVADRTTVAAATKALGYRYAYDAASDQFAHDAAAFLFRPDGGLATTLSETATPAPLMRAAIAAAAKGAPPPPGLLARAATLCFGLGAVHGRYGGAIVLALRVGAVALLLAAVGLWLYGRRRARPC